MSETVAEFVARYPDDYNRAARDSEPRWNRKSQADLRSALKPFAKAFGHFDLEGLGTLTADDFRPWAAGQPAAYVQRTRSMLSDAEGSGLIARNPLRTIRLERGRGRRDIDVLNEGEIDRLCQFAVNEIRDGAQFAAMIATAAYTGVRVGELCALRQEDVQIANGTLDVKLSYNGHVVKRPKNGRTREGIILPDAAARWLELAGLKGDTAWGSEPCETCAGHVPQCIVCGGEGRVHWMFKPRTRKHFDKASLYYLWHPVREAAGHAGMQFHELRHAAATMLLERGVEPADVAWQLGHTDGGKLVRELYGEPHRAAQGRRDRIREALRG